MQSDGTFAGLRCQLGRRTGNSMASGGRGKYGLGQAGKGSKLKEMNKRYVREDGPYVQLVSSTIKHPLRLGDSSSLRSRHFCRYRSCDL